MLIALRQVSKRYGAVHALSQVTAEITGQVIGLLGPNGAGKSTMLKVMLGLIDFDGEATVLGRSPRTESFAIRDRVGYMPEMDCYLPGMNAVELCAYAGELSGLPRADAMQRAHAALYYVNLEDKRYQKVDGYSTGLKQRVKLAQALVHDPELLFLDEPTNGLDPGAREEMLELITELPRRRGCSIILSTHLLPDVERVCDEVMIMQKGQLKFAGSVEQLRGADGGDRVFTVEVKAHAERVAAELSTAGCIVDVVPPLGLTVTLADGADPRVIFSAARSAGSQVRRLEPHRLSFEDAFMRELDAPANASPLGTP